MPLNHLHEVLAGDISTWRKSNHMSSDYPSIAEILEWASNPDGSGFKLRPPQLRALETYWYLRLVEETAHVFDLYKRHFSPDKDPDSFLSALGIPDEAFKKSKYNMKALLKNVLTNDEFAAEFKLEALRETLSLKYPSYIFALAMGAGKTALVGAIIATEFAMALEYPKGPFVQNALVFAPGLTIIESLRELAEIPYDRILPQRLYKQFAASVKLTFTRDGDPDIPIIERSSFNIVVTNTEKIRIQKETIRKSDIGNLFAPPDKEDEARAEVANRRLRKIASLPHLAVFSDEAHHTYGQALDTELKKVRKTVDYLHKESPNLICVVNTTGTPYYKRNLLRDVVIWYGLSEGIKDGILKDIAENIMAYDFSDDVETYLRHVIEDFFTEYGDVTLPDGTPAKLAMYFPQTNDVEQLRPVIESKLAELGLPATLILEHHTAKENKADFDRFRFKDSPHRVALLVSRGVEGWNVPALFSCALARRLSSANNFVLQAACRCLRQVPGNTRHARIYLSMDNRSILDKQLQETYGETIDDINRTQRKSKSDIIKLRKLNIPPLLVKQIVRTVVRKNIQGTPFRLEKPTDAAAQKIRRTTLTVAEQQSTYKVLREVGDIEEIMATPDTYDVYTAAMELSATYRLDLWMVYDELKRLYGDEELPAAHLPGLCKQVESQICQYEVQEETVERALALVKLDGFDKTVDANGSDVYTAEISYPIDREHLLKHWEKWNQGERTFGFHYSPYNFDSNPEVYFFENMMRELHVVPEDVEDIYFTGALTDPKKTEFYVEYKGEDGKWHRYTPDFIIRKKNGKCLIVEIKAAMHKAATTEDLDRYKRLEAPKTQEGRKAIALQKYQNLNPDKLKYQILYTRDDMLSADQLAAARNGLAEP